MQSPIPITLSVKIIANVSVPSDARRAVEEELITRMKGKFSLQEGITINTQDLDALAAFPTVDPLAQHFFATLHEQIPWGISALILHY